MTDETANGPADPDGPPEGVALENHDEALWRIVIAQWQDESGPGYKAFMPTKKDKKRLSTSRSSMVTAKEAYQNYVEDGGKAASTTWAVTVGQAVDLTVPPYADGEVYGWRACHASLYFGRKSNGEMKKVSKILAAMASNRGCQFDVTDEGEDEP